MELKEAKVILKNKGFLLENNQLDNLDDNEKIMYLYLNLKKDGYDVSKIKYLSDYGKSWSTFDLKINKEINIEKLNVKVKIIKMTIYDDSCKITFTNPYFDDEEDKVYLSKDIEYICTTLPNNMKSFINVDIHNQIYSYFEYNIKNYNIKKHHFE